MSAALRKELDNFAVFEAVTAAAAVRRTQYTPGESGKRYPSKTTIYGPVPVANEHIMQGEEPASGLVLSKQEIVPRGRMFEGLFHGEDYFDGLSDRIVLPRIMVINSMVPDRAKVVSQYKCPAIQLETDLDGIQQRTVLDPSFALGDMLEVELRQACVADWLGVLSLRLPK